MSPFEFVVLALAAYRLFRLLSADLITEPLRKRMYGRARTPKAAARKAMLEEMWTCPWCLGLWVALVVYAAWLLAPGPTLWVALPLALSCVVGFLGNLDD